MIKFCMDSNVQAHAQKNIQSILPMLLKALQELPKEKKQELQLHILKNISAENNILNLEEHSFKRYQFKNAIIALRYNEDFNGMEDLANCRNLRTKL